MEIAYLQDNRMRREVRIGGIDGKRAVDCSKGELMGILETCLEYIKVRDKEKGDVQTADLAYLIQEIVCTFPEDGYEFDSSESCMTYNITEVFLINIKDDRKK